MATRNYSVSNHAVEQFRARLGTHHWASFDDDTLREKLDQAIFFSSQVVGLGTPVISEGRMCTVVDLEPETQVPMVAILTNNEQKVGAGAEFRLVVLTTLTKRMADAMRAEKRWTRPPEQAVQPLTHGLKLQLPQRPVVEKVALKPPATPAAVAAIAATITLGATGPADWIIVTKTRGSFYIHGEAPRAVLADLTEAGEQPVLYRQVKTRTKQVTVVELE